jgi:hypothetical protein
VGSWIERGWFIALGAGLTAYATFFVALATRATRRGWRDLLAVAWILFSRGLPGALFVIAGSAGDRNVMWAAAAVLLAGLVIGPILKRVSSPKHSV